MCRPNLYQKSEKGEKRSDVKKFLNVCQAKGWSIGMDFNKATNAISYALTAITLYDP